MLHGPPRFPGASTLARGGDRRAGVQELSPARGDPPRDAARRAHPENPPAAPRGGKALAERWPAWRLLSSAARSTSTRGKGRVETEVLPRDLAERVGGGHGSAGIGEEVRKHLDPRLDPDLGGDFDPPAAGARVVPREEIREGRDLLGPWPCPTPRLALEFLEEARGRRSLLSGNRLAKSADEFAEALLA